MNTPISASATATATAMDTWPDYQNRDDLLQASAWVMQYKPNAAALLQQERNTITDEEFDDDGLLETPAIARHLDEIRSGDFILFWMCGPGDTAGLYAWGNASGEATERDYPRDWSDLDGPSERKTAMEVWIGEVFAQPFLTRSALKQLPEFDDFELFEMPNRANAFAVTPQQWSIILDHLTGRDTPVV